MERCSLSVAPARRDPRVAARGLCERVRSFTHLLVCPFSRPLAARMLPALIAVALAGCSGDLHFPKEDPPIDPNLAPTDYRDKLVLLLQTSVEDPTSVRDPYISEPALKPFGKESRYVVCVRYNDSQGPHEKMAVYFGGSVNQFVNAAAEQCGGADYQPFPELLRLPQRRKGR
jgi:hypothetical protein